MERDNFKTLSTNIKYLSTQRILIWKERAHPKPPQAGFGTSFSTNKVNSDGIRSNIVCLEDRPLVVDAMKKPDIHQNCKAQNARDVKRKNDKREKAENEEEEEKGRKEAHGVIQKNTSLIHSTSSIIQRDPTRCGCRVKTIIHHPRWHIPLGGRTSHGT